MHTCTFICKKPSFKLGTTERGCQSYPPFKIKTHEALLGAEWMVFKVTASSPTSSGGELKSWIQKGPFRIATFFFPTLILLINKLNICKPYITDNFSKINIFVVSKNPIPTWLSIFFFWAWSFSKKGLDFSTCVWSINF